MKKISLLLVVLILLASFTGCCARGEENTSKTVRFLNFKPEIASVYESIAKKYYEETGVRVIVETAAANTYESTLMAKMSTNEAPTIFQINGPKGYLSWQDYCLDLTNSKIADIITDKSLLLTANGNVYGIPYVVEGYGIIYNDEIMQKFFALPDKETKINSVEEITSFEKLKEVTEEMTKRKKDLGIEGVFASTSLKPGEEWRWQTHLLNIPVHYEFLNRNIKLESEDVKDFQFEYAQNYKNIFDLYLNNSTVDKKMLGSKIVGDSMAEFALGKCAMVQNGNWAYSQISDIPGNRVKKENIKMMPIYMGINDENEGLCIGTENFLCINKKADEETKKEAENFIYWLYSSPEGKKYVSEELGFITPFNTFSENELPDDPLASEVSRWMNKENVHTIPWDFTIFPSNVFKTEFGSDLLLYAQGSKSWDSVKAETVESWKRESGK